LLPVIYRGAGASMISGRFKGEQGVRYAHHKRVDCTPVNGSQPILTERELA
jgi:hypothetical protein